MRVPSDEPAGKPVFPPSHLLLQWHITEHCNLQCAHCYQEVSPPEDLPWATLMSILDQFRELQTKIRHIHADKKTRFHISVTGGEPFVRADTMDFLEVLASERAQWSFAILTNGVLIDEVLARRLAVLKPSFVQVSIDGAKATHDRIRGQGSFDRAVAGIRRMLRNRTPVIISFTASTENYQDFPQVAQLGKRLGVRRVWADRQVPLGAADAQSTLNPMQTRALFESMYRETSHGRRWKPWRRGRRTEIAMHRALQFIFGGGDPYRCSAGNSLITVMANGDVCPCRRMPVVVGNLVSEQLSEVYWNSPDLQRLRHPDCVPTGCEACFYSETCFGGLRCLSAAVYDDSFRADPGCWLASRESKCL